MRSPPELARVASVTERLAVLLAAGVAPTSAWAHVAASGRSAVPARVIGIDPAGIADALVEATARRGPLEAGAWRGLAAAWTVATDAGAPLAPSLRDYARSLRSLAQAQRDAEVALAAPVATARMVMLLPIVGMLFGLGLGFDTVGTLFGTPVGWACLVAGSALMWAASRWNRRLVARARPRDAAPGIAFDLMAIAVSGGASLDRARATLAAVVARFALPPPGDGVEEVLELSRRAGVPAADLLRSEAEEVRREAHAAAQERAAALGVRLMLPLGLCILPAFILLGVLPLLIAVLSSTASTF